MIELKEKILRRLELAEERAEFYSIEDDEQLTKYGMWSKGYWIGRKNALEDVLDFIAKIENVE